MDPVASVGNGYTLERLQGGHGLDRFKSTERYIASRDLEVAVNAAVALQRPLLIKGEPGTGKTVLAHEVARRSAAT